MTLRIIKNHVIIPTNNPGQLRAVFPSLKEATVQGVQVCAVPHTLDSARVLNNLGYDVHGPIRTEYDWPGWFKPRWYQTDTADFLTLNPRAHCLNQPRTGKTLASLWASDYLMKQGVIKKALIVAPLSTLEDVWASNIFKHFHKRRYAVLHGARAKRLELLAMDHDYYIINHHGIGIVEEILDKRPDINLVILDESAEFRNARTKTLWKPLNTVLNKQSIDRWCWGLTGTPTDVAPTDAFGQSKLITPGNYKGHFTSFKNETMYQISQWKWIPRKGWEDTVKNVLRPSICFDRSVCTDMEPCRIYRRSELSDTQTKAYKEMVNLAVTEILDTRAQNKTITAVNAGALVQKLCQIACGVVYGADGEVIKMDFGPRLAILKEAIRQNNEKVIVFVPFTGVLDALAAELRKDWSVAVVDGSVSKTKRDSIFREFRQNKDPHVIVAHPKCMAHGLDLTTASLAIWYAPHNKSTYNQACARIDGSEQKVKIDILHIYATAEEKKAYEVIQEQGRMQDILLDLVKKGG
jgi:hypothetical protein